VPSCIGDNSKEAVLLLMHKKRDRVVFCITQGLGMTSEQSCHGNYSHDDRDIAFPVCKDWTLTVPDSGLLLVRLLDVAQAVNVAFPWILA